jgi:hypothetical protein
MMRLGIRITPPDDNGVFAPDAFSDQMGMSVPLTLDGKFIRSATLADVEYRENGRLAILTLDVADFPSDDNRVTQLFALAMLTSAAYSANLRP